MNASAVRVAGRIVAQAPLPTAHGTFELSVFRHELEPGLEHVAMKMGEVRAERVLVRVHSECMTSEVFGSLKCDCAGQLDTALARIAQRDRGLLVYLRQEGRGIGLANKLRAYALQRQGLDTVDANLALGLPVDARRYDAAAWLLEELGVRSIVLMTNNPDKARALEELGIRVRACTSCVVPPNPESAAYFESKRLRLGHRLAAPQPHQKR